MMNGHSGMSNGTATLALPSQGDAYTNGSSTSAGGLANGYAQWVSIRYVLGGLLWTIGERRGKLGRVGAASWRVVAREIWIRCICRW